MRVYFREILFANSNKKIISFSIFAMRFLLINFDSFMFYSSDNLLLIYRCEFSGANYSIKWIENLNICYLPKIPPAVATYCKLTIVHHKDELLQRKKHINNNKCIAVFFIVISSNSHFSIELCWGGRAKCFSSNEKPSKIVFVIVILTHIEVTI